MLRHALHASFADGADQRTSDRRVLRLEAYVASPSGEGGLQVQNLSRSGLLLEGPAGIAAGCEIEVDLPGGSRHRAQVMWADDTLFGCRFDRPLTQAQLSAALLKSEPPLPSGSQSRLSQADALARLQQHWAVEVEPAPLPAHDAKLPPGKRLWAIAALGLIAWTVPAAAAAWMFW